MLPSLKVEAQHTARGRMHGTADAELSPRKHTMAEVKITFDAADDYERFMGAWSRSIGERFLAWFAAPPDARWLDVGCGTGAFSELILRHCAPASLAGIDPSPEQVDYVRRHLPGPAFQVGDSMDMPFGENTFDVVASALVFHFIPDRRKAFGEMRRVLRSGGLVGGYTWKRTVAENFAPYAPIMAGVKTIGGETLTSPLVPEGTPEGMRASLAAAGFVDIAVTEIEVTRTFANFDEYWDIQCLPFSPPGRTIAKLSDPQRAKLRDVMRERMTPGADGSITYAATAMAGKARKPK
jgi:ubiquinone/menaquinone biosynthesis C-methylase UbiE